MADSHQAKGTLEGYALWALRRYMECFGKKEGTAVTAIFDRWLEQDAEYLATLGITLEQYWLDKAESGSEKPEAKKRSRKSAPSDAN